jgi:hypothetical protein
MNLNANPVLSDLRSDPFCSFLGGENDPSNEGEGREGESSAPYLSSGSGCHDGTAAKKKHEKEMGTLAKGPVAATQPEETSSRRQIHGCITRMIQIAIRAEPMRRGGANQLAAEYKRDESARDGRPTVVELQLTILDSSSLPRPNAAIMGCIWLASRDLRMAGGADTNKE